MIYVDSIIMWPTDIKCFKHGSCHLLADTLDELHDFAFKLGLKRSWFQNTRYPHYDLTPLKQRQAIRLGAKLVDRKELKVIMEKIKNEKE